jgi:excisionase family DNA binding protein
MSASLNDELTALRVFGPAPIPSPQRFLTLQQFCKITATPESTARQWIHDGKLRIVSPNNYHVRVPVEEIDRLFVPKQPKQGK